MTDNTVHVMNEFWDCSCGKWSFGGHALTSVVANAFAMHVREAFAAEEASIPEHEHKRVDCDKTVMQCIQEFEADRDPPRVCPEPDAEVIGFNDGYDFALDSLRTILHDHGWPVSPGDEE